MADKQQDLGPATPGLAHRRQEEAVSIVRDVLGGTLRLRGEAKRYLPRFPHEADEVYTMRSSTAVLFNATKRTVKALAGIVFHKDVEVSGEIPESMREHMNNVDLTGRDVSTFGHDALEEALADGHVCIFVDMPPPVEGAQSPLDERGQRPYWVIIRKQDVLGFDTEIVDGAVVLTSLRYRETITRREGQWREIEVHRIREYWLAETKEDALRVHFRVWELDPDKPYPGEGPDDWTQVGDVQTMSRSTIPLAVAYTNRDAYLESTPPFLDLALENIRHFQTDSDNQNLARTAKVQTLLFTGESAEKIQSVAVGPGNAIVLESEEADAKWIGADGGSFSVFLDDLERQEQRMAIMGLSMLMSESRAAETATSKRIDKSESDSQLAAAAKDMTRALNEARRFHAEWLDLEDAGSLAVNTDFDVEPLDSGTFGQLRELWGERGLSWETLMAILKRGEVLPEGFDLDEERSRIAKETSEAMEREMRLMDGPASDDVDDAA